MCAYKVAYAYEQYYFNEVSAVDKYEYKLKTEQMLELMEKGAYSKAAEAADTIDWKRVRNATMLTNVSDIYEKNGDYQKSYDVLNIAYHRAEGSRKVIYRLCALALKTGNVDEAIDYYDDFIQVAPKDPNQHILKYKILRARRSPVEQQIEALEEFKKAEYIEEWAYELAKLYQEAGMTAECLEECDDLILWFSEGKYVYKAMELKMQYKQLTPSQQEKYDHRYEKLESETEEIPDLTQYQLQKDPAAEADTPAPEHEEEGHTDTAPEADTPAQEPEESIQNDEIVQKLTQKGIASTMRLGEALQSLLRPKNTESAPEPEKAESTDSGHEETEKDSEFETAIEEIESVVDLELVKGLSGKLEKRATFDADLEELRAEPLEETDGHEPGLSDKGDLMDSDVAGIAKLSAAEEDISGHAEAAAEGTGISIEDMDALEDPDIFGAGEGETLAASSEIQQADQESEEKVNLEESKKQPEDDQVEGQLSMEDIFAGWGEPAKVEETADEKKEAEPILPPDIQRMIDEIEGVLPEGPVAEPEPEPEIEDVIEEIREDIGGISQQFNLDNPDELLDDTEAGEAEIPVAEAYTEGEEDHQEDNLELAEQDSRVLSEDHGPAYEEAPEASYEEVFEPAYVMEDEEVADAYEEELEEDEPVYEDAQEDAAEPGYETVSEETFDAAYEEEYEEAVDSGYEEEYREDLEAGYEEEYREDLEAEYEEEYEEAAQPEYEEELEAGIEAEYEEEYEEGLEEDEPAYEGELEEDESAYEDMQEDVAGEDYSSVAGPEYEEAYVEEAEAGYEDVAEPDYQEDYEETPGLDYEEAYDEADEFEYEEEYEEEAESEYDYETADDFGEEEEYSADGVTEAYDEEYPQEEGEEYLEDIEASFEEEFRINPEHSSEPDDREIPDEDDNMDILSATTPLSRKETAKMIATGKTAPIPIDEISDALSMSDTGFIVHGRYDLETQSGIGTRAGLTEEQKKLFSYFVPVRGMSEQLVDVLEQDRNCTNRSGTSRTGNLLIIGNKGNGKTVLAVDVVKAIQKQRNIRQGKVAIVTGDSLNKKKISDIFTKLYGGALIIEKAGKLNEKTVARINKAMERDTGEMMIVLEEQRKPLDRLLSSNREFRRKFTSRLEVPIFINDELVTFGQTYAQENGYRIDEMGILALYSRIDNLQREDHAVTVAEVKEVMDEAMEHSQKASAKKLVKRVFGKNTDDADRIILSEKDFNI